MTGAELLREAVARLKRAGIPDPARDARLLLAGAMECAPGRLTLVLPDPVEAGAEGMFRALVERRAAREPVSQLLGRRAFFGRMFRVNADVLDPRPETETLVEAALALDWTRVLDLGTGSGAILLTLLAERPDATGLGTDISEKALRVAAGNREALGLTRRAELEPADWGVSLTGQFDLVVSNPPYIAAGEYTKLAPEPRLYEPKAALTPGTVGLEAYRRIAPDLPRLMAPGAHALFEIGPTQADEVATILRRAGLCELRVYDDLDGRNRVVQARNGA